ncbi:MAG: phosphoserine phosphatase SerB [Beijerinckiaceae bacterium]
MTSVAILISNPASPSVEADLVARVASQLPNAAATRWLSPGIAAEVAFASADADIPALTAQLREMIGAHPVDVAILRQAHRRKKLLLADMDSTMIEQECIDELAAFVGLKDKVSAITARAMRGEIAFEPALRERVALLKGLPVTVVDDIIAKHITLMPGGKTLIPTMKANGAYCALVSGGFTVFTSKIGQILGFDEDRSNILEVSGGKLEGLVRDPILGKEAKQERLIQLRNARGLLAEEVMAVGDGANDLAMLGEAGLGVALHAKPAVAAAAHVRIDHGDLTALLFLQGYSADAFVG